MTPSNNQRIQEQTDLVQCAVVETYWVKMNSADLDLLSVFEAASKIFAVNVWEHQTIPFGVEMQRWDPRIDVDTKAKGCASISTRPNISCPEHDGTLQVVAQLRCLPY